MVEHAALAVRLLLAALFLAAAVGKARSFAEFQVPLRGLGVPAGLTRAGTAGLIVWETALAVLLAGGWLEPVAVAAAGLLVVVFAAISVHAAARRLHVACNCFGRSASELGAATAVRAVLMGGALALYAAAPRLTLPTDPAALVREAALVLALALGMLVLASWGVVLPALLRLLASRRASRRDVSQVLGALRRAEIELPLGGAS